jgi:hypothetical protein
MSFVAKYDSGIVAPAVLLWGWLIPTVEVFGAEVLSATNGIQGDRAKFASPCTRLCDGPSLS